MKKSRPFTLALTVLKKKCPPSRVLKDTDVMSQVDAEGRLFMSPT